MFLNCAGLLGTEFSYHWLKHPSLSYCLNLFNSNCVADALIFITLEENTLFLVTPHFPSKSATDALLCEDS